MLFPGQKSFSLPVLAQYDGVQNEKIYFSVNGIVYDASKSDSFRPGGVYGDRFAGKDCTISLAKMSLSSEFVNQQTWQSMTNEEKQSVASWISYFDEKYYRIGKVKEFHLNESYAASNARFLEENKKRSGWKETKSGLQYRIIKKGEGKSKKEAVRDEVTPCKVQYKGKLACADGHVFDSTKSPIICRPSDMIPGWREALMMMEQGDRFEIVLPPNLGYGSAAFGSIPAFSTLIFEIELVQVAEEKKAKKEENDDIFFYDGRDRKPCHVLANKGWSKDDVDTLRRLLQIDYPEMSNLCMVRTVNDDNETIPVLWYGKEFAAKVRFHIEKTGQPVGAAPLLPHTQVIPLRLSKYYNKRALVMQNLRNKSEKQRYSKLNLCDRNLALCLDMCFWADDVSPGGSKETKSNAELKRMTKNCYRSCADDALQALDTV
eukprot:g5797.t1